MEFNAGKIVRVLKRLRAAVGYQELGMTQHALCCLDSLASMSNIGPFGLIAEVLRDQFVKYPESHVPADKALEMLACMLPTPSRNAIRLTLTACYGQLDAAGRAANKRASARAPNPKPNRNLSVKNRKIAGFRRHTIDNGCR